MVSKGKSIPQEQQNLLILLLFGVVLLVAIGVRVRLLDFPLERDEGEYAYAGQLILEGIPPYQVACNMKLPGIYLSYAAIMALFGQSPAGIHLGLIAIHLLTLTILFFLARRFLSLTGAATATAAYALLSLSPSCYGLAAHATHFIMLPALLGTWVLIRIKEQVRRRDCLVAGGCFGIAFLMKQPAIFFGLFGGGYLLLLSSKSKHPNLKRIWWLGLYSLGWLLPFLAVCLWLKLAGVFPQFWFWTVSYAHEYVRLLSVTEGIVNLKTAIFGLITAAPGLWLLASMGLLSLVFSKWPSQTRRFIACFLFFAFLATCPGWYFRGHYLIVLLPGIALLAGLAVDWLSRQTAVVPNAFWKRCLPLCLAMVACLQSLYADRTVFFSYSPYEACRSVYGPNPFPESIEIAKYLAQNTRNDQRIVIVGSEPQIYFYAHRHSAASAMHVYPLMEPQPFARKMQENLIQEIEAHSPEYLVYVSIRDSWGIRPDSIRLVPDWLPGYTSREMQMDGLVQFISPQNIETVWGVAAATTRLQSDLFIAIYKRKPAPSLSSTNTSTRNILALASPSASGTPESTRDNAALAALPP